MTEPDALAGEDDDTQEYDPGVPDARDGRSTPVPDLLRLIESLETCVSERTSTLTQMLGWAIVHNRKDEADDASSVLDGIQVALSASL